MMTTSFFAQNIHEVKSPSEELTLMSEITYAEPKPKESLYDLDIVSFSIENSNISNSHSSISKNPMDWIGVEHNVGLRFLLGKIKERPQKKEINSRIRSILLEKYPKEYFKDTEKFDGLYTFEDWLNFTKEQCNDRLYNSIMQVITIVQNEPTLENILNNIESIEGNAPNRVDTADVERYYAFLSVIRHSATFWLPEQEGGNGGLNLIQFPSLSNAKDAPLKRFKAWKCIVTDGLGTICGGVGGPPGAIIGGISASGSYVISEW